MAIHYISYLIFTLVDAYGKVAIFSLVYVTGAQLSLFNILSSFAVPFYHIYVRFGAGFVYDVTADAILLVSRMIILSARGHLGHKISFFVQSTCLAV